jgi:hypothetical protein
MEIVFCVTYELRPKKQLTIKHIAFYEVQDTRCSTNYGPMKGKGVGENKTVEDGENEGK